MRPLKPDREHRESRKARIAERVRAIPEGFVRTYGDCSPGAPESRDLRCLS